MLCYDMFFCDVNLNDRLCFVMGFKDFYVTNDRHQCLGLVMGSIFFFCDNMIGIIVFCLMGSVYLYVTSVWIKFKALGYLVC